MEEIADWISGGDGATIGALFEQLPVKRFDILVMQIKKDDLLPQHWQVISTHGHPDAEELAAYPSVRRLRQRYGSEADQRLANLQIAWEELRGKQPTLWSVSDLIAALRRIIDKGRDVDMQQLLTAVRDVWAGMSVPQGQENLDVLWRCLAVVRSKTKK